MKTEDLYNDFVKNAQDDHYLVGLVDTLNNYNTEKKSDSTTYLGVFDGKINNQYEIMVSPNGFVVYDSINKDSITLFGKTLDDFINLASKEILGRCQ